MKLNCSRWAVMGGIALFSTQACTASDLLVGTYTEGNSQGIYRYAFDSHTGHISPEASQIVNSENPSWLTFNADQSRLYAVNENGPDEKAHTGAVSAYSIDPATHQLTLINKRPTLGDEPTYSSLTADAGHLLVANYAVHPDPGGSLAVLPVQADGALAPVSQREAHLPSGVNPERQVGSHVHSVVSAPGGQYVYVQDLGADKVFIYRYDPANIAQPLTPALPPVVTLPAGSGPRHLVFSHDGRHAYLTLEMAGAVVVFDVFRGNLIRTQLASLSLVRDPAYQAGAALHLSPDGKFLYASNRGKANELVVFGVAPGTGKLRLLQRRAVEGVEPREFTLDPSGHFLLVANQKSNQIVVMARDTATGLLGNTTQALPVDSPSDIKFFQ